MPPPARVCADETRTTETRGAAVRKARRLRTPSRPRVRMPLSAAAAAAVLVATMTLTAAPASSATIKSTVFTHGENGWPYYRIPGTLSLPFGVLLSFAAARSFTGDVRCTPAAMLARPCCLPAAMLALFWPDTLGACAACSAALLPAQRQLPKAIFRTRGQALHRSRRLL